MPGGRKFSAGLLAIGVVLVAGCSSTPSQTDVSSGKETPSSTQVGGGAADLTVVLLEAALAGRTDLVRDAIERGADPSAKGGDSRTALMLAAFDGHTETLRALLEAGGRVDDRKFAQVVPV